jgi:hypothetical protein
MRVQFCGAINGSVTVRKGETPQEALQRAQDLLLALMDRGAKSLGNGDGHGPNVGLELDVTE